MNERLVGRRDHVSAASSAAHRVAALNFSQTATYLGESAAPPLASATTDVKETRLAQRAFTRIKAEGESRSLGPIG